jgi:acetylornithine deacetylase/succinyl-diaminopimelate desuccinylase-like protein
LRLSKEELGAIHGKNERVSFENMALAVRFYLSLLTS